MRQTEQEERRAADHRARRRRRVDGRLALSTLLLLVVAAGCRREPEDVWYGPPQVEQEVTGAAFHADALVLRGASARRVAAYRLSTDRIERWFAAQERLENLAIYDPEVAHFLSSADAPSARDERAIDQAIARVSGVPVVRNAIEAAGVSPTDFVLTALAMHQALLATQQNAPVELRRLASRNMQFVASNRSLLAQQAIRSRVDLAWTDSIVAEYPDPYADDWMTPDTLDAYADTSAWALPPDPLRTDTLLPPPELPPLPLPPPAPVPPPVPLPTPREAPPPSPVRVDTAPRPAPQDTGVRVPAPLPPPLPAPLPRPTEPPPPAPPPPAPAPLPDPPELRS